MKEPMRQPEDKRVALGSGVTLHVRQWAGDRRPFVLVHGLSSNCMTWEMVARRLAHSGHTVVAVDQRGHGLSDKPEGSYDFATVTGDLQELIDVLELRQPIVAGQSWGGNVALELAARYPGLCGGYAFVDGGFLDLQSRPGATWEETSERLRPAEIDGTQATALRARIRQSHPDWADEGVDATLANFDLLDDGTVRRRLSVRHHMAILRSLWDQRPRRLYPQVAEPVLICPAQDDGNIDRTAAKRAQVDAAQTALAHAEVVWFHQTDHDIHVHRPDDLAALLLRTVAADFWQ